MSEEHPPQPLSIAKRLLWLAGFLCKIVLILFLLLVLLQIFGGFAEPGFHLVAGWFFFLRDHLAHMSTNAATWIPGLAAFLIAIGVGHTFLRAWAKQRQQRWPLGTTLALALIVPILFVISFLVPGIILQTKQMTGIKWRERSASIDNTLQRELVQSLQWSLFEAASPDEAQGRFPGTLNDVGATKEKDRLLRTLGFTSKGPVDLPIYLGGGFSVESDPDLPLLISQPFAMREGDFRHVVTIGGRFVRISDEETDAWIQRSLDARASKAR